MTSTKDSALLTVTQLCMMAFVIWGTGVVNDKPSLKVGTRGLRKMMIVAARKTAERLVHADITVVKISFQVFCVWLACPGTPAVWESLLKGYNLWLSCSESMHIVGCPTWGDGWWSCGPSEYYNSL